MRSVSSLKPQASGRAGRPRALLGFALLGMTAPIARADLAENQVLLLWNSADPESNAIGERYRQLHPGVISCDLNLVYPTSCFFAYPSVALSTLGKHHQHNVVQVDPDYIRHYRPHLAGVFLSFESFNGWTIHAGDLGNMFPTNPSLNQGSVLDWIGAGGGFSIADLQEPAPHLPNTRVLFKNFLVRRLTWGESALSYLPVLGQFQAPIGDPLADLTVFNPDITGPNGEPDRIVDQPDRNLVNQQFGKTGPGWARDINQDNVVNAADRALIMEAWGRNCTEPPTEPKPGVIRCGDMNEDAVVDEHDLDQCMDLYNALAANDGACPLLENWITPCAGDFNEDGHVDDDDLAIITENQGKHLYDLNCDGDVDGADVGIVLAAYGTCIDDDLPSTYVAAADNHCDGCVDHADNEKLIFFYCEDCTGCQQ
jgi:hypothetical protein